MIYSGSIVFVKPEDIDDARTVIAQFPELEIHAVGEDSTQIVVSIETEDDTRLSELVAQLKNHECIMDVGHHIMHFGEDVDKILSGEKTPDISAFQRSKRRLKNPLEDQL